MKKLLTFATILLVAHAAQGISFKWGVDGGVTYVGSGNKVGGITATLVYLGEGASAAYSIGDWVVNNPTPSTAGGGTVTATSLSTPPVKAGSFTTRTYTLQEGAQVGASVTDIMTAGSSTFGLFLTYTDSENVTWYNVSSQTYTIPAGSSDITTGLTTNFAFDWKQNERGVALTSGGGWAAAAATPIPEPSTAALALAGLAMLIKRRKA